MAKIIEAPTSVALTEAWHEVQKTNIYMFQKIDSYETNQLLKALGKGSYFVVRGFNLALFKIQINNIWTCVARLTPGILVQDFTVIDYLQPMKELGQYIYVKVFDEHDAPSANTEYKIGSRYYHGTYGDGINARPTYSTISAINYTKNENQTNFKTFYRITLDPNYPTDHSVDLDHLIIQDFRFHVSPKTNSDPTDDPDKYSGIFDEDENADDINQFQSRSNSLLWALVFGGY